MNKPLPTPPYLDVDDEDDVFLVVDPTLPGGKEMDFQSVKIGKLPHLDLDMVPEPLRAQAERLIKDHERPEDLRRDDERNYYAGLGDPGKW